MMQVIVVPNTGLEGLARRLAFQIGQTAAHTCSVYTVQHYCDSEPSLFVSRHTNAAVVFLGKSEPAEDLRPILPQRFADHGVSCFRQGRRAVIDATLPVDASALELVNLYSRVAGSSLSSGRTSPKLDMRPLPRLARGLASTWRRHPKETAKDPRRVVSLAALLAGQAAGAGLVPGVSELSVMGALGFDAAQMRKLRRQVGDELYAYGASRFLEEELPTMVESS